VWNNAQLIQEKEGGDGRVLVAAVLLHDCLSIEKDSPLRTQASRLAAEKARGALATLNWGSELIERVAHAIEAHSITSGIRADTLEARILQDADRLDAMGMIGVARCFYVAGRLGSAFYDHHDPHAQRRGYDEKRFTIDHLRARLLNLPSSLHTVTGVRLARVRAARLHWFLEAFLGEVSGAELSIGSELDTLCLHPGYALEPFGPLRRR
jgi:uncharacterized protein